MQKQKLKDDPKGADPKKGQQPNLNLDQNHRQSHSNEKLQEKQPRTHHCKLQKQGKGRER